MDKLYGWTGKLLRADLSAGTVTTMDTRAYLPTYVGGLGIAARIAWDELEPGVGPFDPENMLFVMVGPLTGTVASGAGRVVVAGIAPQQNPPAFSRSGVGGHWGAELKYAGYDGVIIVGQAEKPVYLWIEDDPDTGGPAAELRDAADLWGRGTFATTTALRQRHGPATRVMSCGPAGENLCRIACMQTETGNAAGQGGYGAVMGSKRLKAIAVRGTGGVPVADPGRLMDLVLDASREGMSWGGQDRSVRNPRGVESPIPRRLKKCGFCAMDCASYHYMGAPGQTTSGGHNVHPFCYMYFQSPEARLESAALTSDLGLNGWETSFGVIAWLQMCKQQGLVDTFDGIEIPVPDKELTGVWDIARYPPEFSNALLHKMAYREGELGDALADGACYAAQRLFGGRGLPLLDRIYPRRMGQTSHWNAHWLQGVAFPYMLVPLLQWCVDTRDPASDSTHGYAQHMLTYLPDTGRDGGGVTLEQAARGVRDRLRRAGRLQPGLHL